MNARICELCNQPLHRHNDRVVRYECTYCTQELCDLQVEVDEKGLYRHAGGRHRYCIGVVKKL